MKYLITLLLFPVLVLSQNNCDLSETWYLEYDCETHNIYLRGSESSQIIEHPNLDSYFYYDQIGSTNEVIHYYDEFSPLSPGEIFFDYGLAQSHSCFSAFNFRAELNFFYNGVECYFFGELYIPECYCYEPEFSAELNNIDETIEIRDTKYGDIHVPITCDLDFTIDSGNCQGKCIDHYAFTISEFNPSNWTYGNTLYESGWIYTDIPSNLNLNSYANLIPGNFYMIQLAVGPTWEAEYILIQYASSNADLQFINPTNTYTTVNTIPYGPVEIPIYCKKDLRFNGSTSTCEDEYRIIISEFDAISWSDNQILHDTDFISGEAPNYINIFDYININNNPDNVYRVKLITVNSWSEENLYFKLKICEKPDKSIKVSPNPFVNTISIHFEKPQTGSIEILNMYGHVFRQEEFVNQNTIDLNMRDLDSGIYFAKFYIEGNIYIKKILKN